MPLLPIDRRAAALAAAGAALFAAVEVGAALTIGRFFDWGRAEATLFYVWRPVLALVAAVAVMRWDGRRRALFYALAMAFAAVAETALLLWAGAQSPWAEAARGIAGGALLFLVLDLIGMAARATTGRWARAVVGLMGAALLLLPGALRPYEAVVVDRDGPPLGPKPRLMLMTALPIVWGEQGPFDPASRPAESYKALQAEFDVELVDTLRPETLAEGGLLLLAQPNPLAPAELAALDEWIRGGGKALILTDPALAWPSELPLGDVRRPPAIGLLGPLLAHWGLGLEAPTVNSFTVHDLPNGRRVGLAGAGTLRVDRPGCAAEAEWLVRCRLGKGEAVVAADADLMNDALWHAPGPGGGERHRRLSDNMVWIAETLDGLAGTPRPRAGVAWARRDIE